MGWCYESQQQQKKDSYIILIGDSKTYQHLMEEALQFLLIFPGDWHVSKLLASFNQN